MSLEPDFYMYSGDGNQAVLGVLRACRKLKTVACGTESILIVATDPPLGREMLREGAMTNVLGLTSRSHARPIEQITHFKVTGAVVWEIYELAEHDCKALPNVGLAALFSEKPVISENGAVTLASALPSDVIEENVTAFLEDWIRQRTK